jgi:hypothetical protein
MKAITINTFLESKRKPGKATALGKFNKRLIIKHLILDSDSCQLMTAIGKPIDLKQLINTIAYN